VTASMTKDSRVPEKMKKEMSSELHHSGKIQVNNVKFWQTQMNVYRNFLILKSVICPEFSQITQLLETGIKLFPSYLWHVLKSLPLTDEEFREHFQVSS